MTDWRTLPAGPELDAEVARRVFGWKFQQPRHGWCCTCQRCGRATDVCQGEYACDFSENIAAAWLVVERMRELKFYIGIHDEMDDGYTVDFCVGPDDEGHLIGVSRAEADTAPLAVCRAALAALEPPA